MKEKDKQKNNKEELNSEKETSEKNNKKEIQEQNKILKNFFIFIGALLFVVIIIALSFNIARHFEYNNMEFEIVKEGQITFYHTTIPLYSNNQKIVDYNIYIRNDPRNLEKEIPFNGNFIYRKNLVINSSGNFNCNGDGVISTVNMINLLNRLGIKVVKDANATCDEQNRYIYLNLRSTNTSSIEQVNGKTCYNMNINNCEILKTSERFMLEVLKGVKID